MDDVKAAAPVQCVYFGAVKPRVSYYAEYWEDDSPHTIIEYAENTGISRSSLDPDYVSTFVDADGTSYTTLRQYMLAAKADIIGREALRDKLIGDRHTVLSADEAAVLYAPSDDWDAVRYETAVRGNVLKFDYYRDMRRFLLSTAGRVPVYLCHEASYWGVDRHFRRTIEPDPALWNGGNRLGLAIMEARDILAAKCRRVRPTLYRQH